MCAKSPPVINYVCVMVRWMGRDGMGGHGGGGGEQNSTWHDAASRAVRHARDEFRVQWKRWVTLGFN